MRRRLRSDRLNEIMAEDGLTAIALNVNRVTCRLDELMDIALPRAGHMLDLAREPVDLRAVAAARAESYQQTIERHRIVLELPDEPLIGLWDTIRIERVIDNLFSNAIKYSHGGAIEIDRVEGKGSTFTVWLPLESPGADRQPEARARSGNRSVA